ncbi:histidine kinase N-terminal 7TM domain-containing protein [Halorientalis halophila]|uniref:sensor histidine kinase n=1 Tax=Halorientalis halophila TaxID=3108499 RepID=UPI003008ECC0
MQFPIFLPVLGLTFIVVVALAYNGWRLRPKPGATWFVLTMLSLGIWTVGEIMVVVNTSLEAKLFWLRFLLFGPAITGQCWFFFATRYTGRDSLHRPATVAVLFGLPLAYVAHGIFVRPFPESTLTDVTLTSDGGLTTLSYGLQPGPTAYVAASYLLVGVASYFLFTKFLRSRNVYRTRNFVLLTTGVLILVGHTVSLLGYSPLPNLMLGLFLFPLGGLLGVLGAYTSSLYYWFSLDGLLRRISSRFSDVVPLARQFIVEEIPTGFVVLDDEGRIVDVNPTARSVLGENRRIVGKRFADVVADDGPLQVLLDEDGALEETEAEVWIDEGADSRCISIRVTGVGGDEDRDVGDVILMHDVTERKESEERLRRQNEQLEEFAGIVSHDLRNPLNVASGHVELAQAGNEESLDEAAAALDRMEDLIDDVLTMARQSQTVEETTTLSLDSIAREAWSNVDTADATLVTDGDGTVAADESRLLQLLENLYRNSIEHGRPDVTVRVGTLDDGFYVEDTGPGIAPERRSEVFDRGVTSDEDGTGLGLSIVESVVEAHGWEIALAEGTEGGARFEVRTERGDGDLSSLAGDRTSAGS